MSGKSKKRLLLEKILKYFATKALQKFKPRIVGVTGSVGKTSTKDAIYKVLSAKYRVGKSEKNYNTEIGLPLTILGIENTMNSFLNWGLVFLRAINLLIFVRKKSYPEILVLEMGADRPGDIKYLVDFIQPETGVMTSVGISHLKYFKDKKYIAKEKSFLLQAITKNGLAILNYDDEEIRSMAENLKIRKIFYGFADKADIHASDIFYGYEKAKDFYGEDVSKIKGISFKLGYAGVTIPVRLIRSIGRPQIYSVMAAAAVGIHFEMNLLEVAEALKDFQSPAGRLNLIEGIKNTVIIEDSYNAAPQSTLAALEVLEKIQARRKIAVLGDMLELGKLAESGHREVGKKVAEIAEILFTVGDKAKFIADQAIKSGLDKNKVFCYDDSTEARIPIQKELREGDVILIKGSQGARMEKISEEIMRYPDQAEKLLPRQTAEWKNK